MEWFSGEHSRPSSVAGYKRIYNRVQATWSYCPVAPSRCKLIQWDFCNDRYFSCDELPSGKCGCGDDDDPRPECRIGFRRVWDGSKWIYVTCPYPDFDPNESFWIWDPCNDEYVVLDGLKTPRNHSVNGNKRFYNHKKKEWDYYCFLDFPTGYDCNKHCLVWDDCNDEYRIIYSRPRISKKEEIERLFPYLMFRIRSGHLPSIKKRLRH